MATKTTQLNWAKFKSEVSKIKDLDSLKKEWMMVKGEIQKFDINSHISPSAKKRLKKAEKRYMDFVKSLNGVQKQLDDEINKAVSFIKGAKKDVEKRLVVLKKAASQHKIKFDQVSVRLKSKVTKKAVTPKTSKTSTKKVAKKTKAVNKTSSRTTKKKKVVAKKSTVASS